jgi:bidirectional [NiFe] hydrogenase diaphorase subunit
VANGNCELQDLAIEVGMDHSRFPYRFPKREVDISHPLFGIDHNRCVLCTRCVRVCDEIEGAHVWDLAYCGEKDKIIAGMDQPWGSVSACTSCGKCVAAFVQPGQYSARVPPFPKKRKIDRSWNF